MNREQKSLLSRGVTEVIIRSELAEKLDRGEILRLKQGFDPSRPAMHIGHAVGLRKLREFQDFGHQVVLIVGDWTAQIGDPTGKDLARPRLTASEVKANADLYMEQFFKVVRSEGTEVRWQSEWYGEFKLGELIDIASRFTLAQLLSHETFRQRYESGQSLSLLEMMYPILQAYDSVAVDADVEFGGTDQKFNILAGRTLMGSLGMCPQHAVLLPLVPGTDGRKMGKSLDNTIDLVAAPDEMYGKIMSMSDEVIPLYFEVLTDVDEGEIERMRYEALEGKWNPRNLKLRLAEEIVALLHGSRAGADARESFLRQFVRRELPIGIPNYQIAQPTSVVDLLVDSGLTSSRSEARRLIDGRGVRVDGQKVLSYDLEVTPGSGIVLQVGRRRFVRVL